MRGIYPQLSQETMRLIHPSAWKGDSANFANTAFSEVGATLRCLFLLRTDHQHRAVGMAHYRVRYAAHQRSSHSPQSPTAFLEKGEPLRERSPQHSVSTKGLGPCASQPGGPFSSRTAVLPITIRPAPMSSATLTICW